MNGYCQGCGGKGGHPIADPRTTDDWETCPYCGGTGQDPPA